MLLGSESSNSTLAMAGVVKTVLVFACVIAGHFLSEQQVLCAKGLTRNTERGLFYANFVNHLFHYLNISQVGSDLVHEVKNCAYACLRVVTCFSFNVAAYVDVNGHILCELLASDKYNSSDKFQANPSFHHFSIYNPCSKSPCMNGGTCIALYYRDDYKCKCPKEIQGRNCETANGCSGLYKVGFTTSGVYSVNPDNNGTFSVYCDMTTDGGGWTVFQRRKNGSQDFYLGWSEYKAGFGQLTDEFWLGNDKIHVLTAARPSELRVEIEDWSGGRAYAKYGSFRVEDEQSWYRLNVGSYSGTAKDSLANHNNMSFTSKDIDNDQWSGGNCAMRHTGAWWYNACYASNLNGQYLVNKVDDKGIAWTQYKSNDLSMKFAEMKLRPIN